MASYCGAFRLYVELLGLSSRSRDYDTLKNYRVCIVCLRLGIIQVNVVWSPVWVVAS